MGTSGAVRGSSREEEPLSAVGKSLTGRSEFYSLSGLRPEGPGSRGHRRTGCRVKGGSGQEDQKEKREEVRSVVPDAKHSRLRSRILVHTETRRWALETDDLRLRSRTRVALRDPCSRILVVVVSCKPVQDPGFGGGSSTASREPSLLISLPDPTSTPPYPPATVGLFPTSDSPLPLFQEPSVFPGSPGASRSCDIGPH